MQEMKTKVGPNYSMKGDIDRVRGVDNGAMLLSFFSNTRQQSQLLPMAVANKGPVVILIITPQL